MRGGVSSTRIRIFKMAANRGIGEEIMVIYDAKHVGSQVLANDTGSAYWTLPINHKANAELPPLQRHYKIERFNTDTDSYDLVGAGIIASADITNDEVVYNGMDYMSVMDMHYTPVLGANPTSTSPLSYPAGTTKPTTEKGNATLTATRSASGLKGVSGTNGSSTYTGDPWNSNDTEIHIPVGNSGITVGSAVAKYRGAIKFDLSTWTAFTSASNITKAELRLWQVGVGLTPSGHVNKGSAYGARTLYVTQVPSDVWTDTTGGSEGSWVDSSVNAATLWTANGTTYESSLAFGNGDSPDGSLKKIDVTALVQAWKAGTVTNYGFRLATGRGSGSVAGTTDVNAIGTENTSNRGLEFYSTAASKTEFRPQLYIEYEKVVQSTNANYDTNGLFAAQLDTRALLQKSRCSSASGDVEANAAANGSGLGVSGLPRTPQAVYITRSSRADIVAMTTVDARSAELNRVSCTFDETDQKYTIKGYVQYERSDNGTALTPPTYVNTFYDYVNSRTVVPNVSTNVKSVDIHVEASPGGPAFSVRAWSPSLGAAAGANAAYSLEFPFWIEVYKSDQTAIKDINPPYATAPTATTTVWTASRAGISSYPMPASPMYKIPILAADGQAFEFSVSAVVTLDNASVAPAGAPTEIISSSAAVAEQSASPLALRNETLQNILARFLTNSGGVFNIPDVEGTTVGRLNWVTIENVEIGGGWPTNKIRYFSTGEQMVGFLRNICDKQMNANQTSVFAGVQLPDRTIFNFVGVRRANGTPADGTKLYVHPQMGFETNDTNIEEYNYPGEIGSFRYVHDGAGVRNSVQVIASTPFITGTFTNMAGVRLQGTSTENTSSMKEYGYAPMLIAKGGFVDQDEAKLEASKLLEQRYDLETSSQLIVKFENDTINPFYDVFLGDVVKINIRRLNVSPYEPDENAFPNLVTSTFIVSGVVYKYNPDGSEDIQLQLLSNRYFSAGRIPGAKER